MAKRTLQVDDIKRYKHVSEPRFHPDGNQILFTRRELGAKNKNRSHIFTVDCIDQTVKQWTFGEVQDSSARWAPDGNWISFLSKRSEKATQIFLLSSGGGEARVLTALPDGVITDLKWSPDGKRIAFLFRETHADFTTSAAEARKESGASTPPVVINSLHYRMDGDGYFGDQRFELRMVDVESGEVRTLYAGAAIDFYSYDWANDSKSLYISHPVFEKNYIQEISSDAIFRVTIKGKVEPVKGLPIGEKGSLSCSPDGEWLAFIGYCREEDERGEFNRELFVLNLKSGELTNLSEGDDYCLAVGVNSDTKSDDGRAIRWSPDSKAIYTQVGWHGAMQLGYVPISEKGVRLLTKGAHLVYLGDVSPDGERIACTFGTATRLQEVAQYDLAKHPNAPKVLTEFNRDFYDEVSLSEPEEHWIESTDGAKVQAWLIKPAGFQSKKKYPAVLEIHGGPHMMYGASYMHEFQLLAAEGYVVVFSNPRGSKGYGESHTGAIRNSWGVKDWEDIHAVTRWMQHHPSIHPGQMGVMGGSYGGYMTNWVIGHCHDFKAAITDRCVSNLVSKAGNSDYIWRPNGYWEGYAYGGWEKIKVLWEHSPIAYFENVKTPTLVIHSEGDLRCNIEQGEQVFAALQQRGIESRFVRYPSSTSHGMSRGGPADLRIHRLVEILNWWKKHLH